MAGEFDQFEVQDTGTSVPDTANEFEQFAAKADPVNEFDAVLDKVSPKSAGQEAVDALMKISTKVAKSGVSGAAMDLAASPAAVAGPVASSPDLIKLLPVPSTPTDPVKFNINDFDNPAQNPMTALTTFGKVVAREEATVANPMLALTKSAFEVADKKKTYWDYLKESPKVLADGLREGLSGQTFGEQAPDRQAQLGDVPRLLGAPEAVSATLGLAASLVLPSQLLMNALPGPKYLSKAENLATNLVARNKWLAEFNAGVADLTKGKAVIEKLVTQDLDPEAMVHLVNWRNALRKSTEAEQVVKLMARGQAKREVLETVKGIKPTDSLGPIIAKGIIESTPADRSSMLKRAMYETWVPIASLDSIFGGTGDFKHVKLNPYKKVIAGVTNASREHEVKLLDAMNPANHGLTEASTEVQAKIRLYDLYKQGAGDPAAEKAAQVLSAKLGITGVPHLTHQEKAFYAYAKKVVNENKNVLKSAYKTVTGQDMKEVRDYVFPLMHEKESRTALQIFSEKLSTGGGGVIGGGTKRFVERTINESMPRTDIFKLLDEQLQAQAWMKHVLPETRKARTAYMHPVYNRGLGLHENEYIANLLNTVEHGGTSAPTSVVEKFLKAGRNNITKAMLAYKVSSALIQYGALFDGMTLANQLWGGKGAKAMLKSMQENLFSPKFTENFSKAIANRRSMGSDAAVAEMSGMASSKAAQLGWAPMKRIDATVAQVTREAFKKALKSQGIEPKINELDMLMEYISGSPNVAMQPSIIHSNEFMRTWLTFQTFALSRWTLLSHSLIENGILAKDGMRRDTIAKAYSQLTKPELFEKTIKEQSFATLSAWKDSLPDATNLRNMGKLEGTLKRMGYRYVRANGGWFDPASNSLKHEASLFVPGMSEEEAVALGKQFNQYSVFTPHGEIRSDGLVKKISNMNDVIIERDGQSAAQGSQIYYHGTDKPFANLGFGERKGQGIFGAEPSRSKVIFLAEDKQNAEFFSTWHGKEGRVIETSLAKDSKILDMTGLTKSGKISESIEALSKVDKEYADLIDEASSTIQQAMNDEKFIENLRKAGYDGVRFVEPEGKGTTVGLINSTKLPDQVGQITRDRLPFTEVKLGDQTIRFHVPQGKVQMIRPGTLTKHVQPHDIVQRKIRATIGLLLLAVADSAENKARAGIADLLSGRDNSSKQRSFGQMMMTALPGQIPFFGNILNAAMNNSSALPPVPRVIEGLIKGSLQAVQGKTGTSKARGVLNAGSSAVSLFAGLPGTSQVAQFLQNFIPEK